MTEEYKLMFYKYMLSAANFLQYHSSTNIMIVNGQILIDSDFCDEAPGYERLFAGDEGFVKEELEKREKCEINKNVPLKFMQQTMYNLSNVCIDDIYDDDAYEQVGDALTDKNTDKTIVHDIAECMRNRKDYVNQAKQLAISWNSSREYYFEVLDRYFRSFITGELGDCVSSYNAKITSIPDYTPFLDVEIDDVYKQESEVDNDNVDW